jgi:hypothetical protein
MICGSLGRLWESEEDRYLSARRMKFKLHAESFGLFLVCQSSGDERKKPEKMSRFVPTYQHVWILSIEHVLVVLVQWKFS